MNLTYIRHKLRTHKGNQETKKWKYKLKHLSESQQRESKAMTDNTKMEGETK